jgi:hypothetical protein
LTELASQLGQVIDSLAEPPPPPEARYLRGLRIAIYGDDPRLTGLRARAEDYGAKIAVNLTKTVAWLVTTTPGSDDKRHSTARAIGIPILSPDEGQLRLDEAIHEAEFKAFERQRQLDEQQARAAHYAAEADAYWRPTWRSRELDRDPEPDWSRS